jgi:hypothetical protein
MRKSGEVLKDAEDISEVPPFAIPWGSRAFLGVIFPYQLLYMTIFLGQAYIRV